MMLAEHKRIVLLSIRELENNLVYLAHCEYDGRKSFEERTKEMEEIRVLLHGLHSTLVDMDEKELGIGA